MCTPENYTYCCSSSSSAVCRPGMHGDKPFRSYDPTSGIYMYICEWGLELEELISSDGGQSQGASTVGEAARPPSSLQLKDSQMAHAVASPLAGWLAGRPAASPAGRGNINNNAWLQIQQKSAFRSAPCIGESAFARSYRCRRRSLCLPGEAAG
ncbi:hypothetical protein BS78_06G281200 [Paspalum vaginatum]|nr:hypothetical protein BS78_06G281200 [Paspalum vaginatum]